MGLQITILLLVFVGTMGVLWSPWIRESLTGKPDRGVATVWTRIFPVGRGLFEDKVASFWCVLHNFKKLAPLEVLPFTLILTLLASAPSCLLLLRNPTPRNFMLSQFSVALAFFLFSFHVHEKQILCPLLFFGLSFPEFKAFFSFFATVCNFSLL